MKKSTIVLDTNTLMSAGIRPYSVPYQAFVKAVTQGIVVYYSETKGELITCYAKTKV